MKQKTRALFEFIEAASPDKWMDYAEELKEAADILWSQTSHTRRIIGSRHESDLIVKSPISRTYTLLTGFAIENLLKGLAVANDPTLINTGILSKSIETHALDELLMLMPRISLTPDEDKMCQIAQQAIPYWGRYPIPLRQEQMAKESILTEEYRRDFENLYNRLHKELYYSIRDGWDSLVGPVIGWLRSSNFEPGMIKRKRPNIVEIDPDSTEEDGGDHDSNIS